ncbi:hypothetical protein [Mycoplasma crocodyli]|uniref:hypothetical protein n=1 Tax=Mycoplasma crocodyli TaxID=50052 RepID=UPI0002F34178|nr:hypothetical protein [Mycoplasma crocodyli]
MDNKNITLDELIDFNISNSKIINKEYAWIKNVFKDFDYKRTSSLPKKIKYKNNIINRDTLVVSNLTTIKSILHEMKLLNSKHVFFMDNYSYRNHDIDDVILTLKGNNNLAENGNELIDLTKTTRVVINKIKI